MKILTVKESFEDHVEVVIEGYPHAQPVFPADITKEELKAGLRDWKEAQDAVDKTNAEAKPPTPVDISDLKSLEGTTVDANIN